MAKQLFEKTRLPFARKIYYFDNRAWQMVIRFEKLAGFWPYRKNIKNYALRVFYGSCLLLFNIGLIRRSSKEWNADFGIVISNIMFLILSCALFMTLVTVSIQGKQRRDIFSKVASHLEMTVDEEEIGILRHHSMEGLRLFIQQLLLVGFMATLFMLLPVLKMYFLYFFGHGLLEKKLPVPLDLMIDEQKYFFPILSFLFIVLISGLIIYLAFGLNVILIVRHNVALFDIVKLRLKRASEIFEHYCDESNKVSNSDEEKAYQIISSAVDLHNEALELTRIFDKAYTVGWLIILLLNAAAFTPLPAAVMLYRHDLFELFRHFLGAAVFPVNFYLIFLQGQLIIDYSSSVFDSCYEFYWYKASKKSRIAILIIMKRSLIPCRLTGGNMFYLSMETYSAMLKTALSYYSITTKLAP